MCKANHLVQTYNRFKVEIFFLVELILIVVSVSYANFGIKNLKINLVFSQWDLLKHYWGRMVALGLSH